MVKNAYILHIDEPRSLQYMNDCLKSCKTFPNINPIPVLGYKGANYQDICADFNISIIPFYTEQMESNGDVLNRAFSCSAGHFKIWQMIVDSGEPGVVLEHDAIVKGDFTNLLVSDDKILWLGPRVDLENDYTYPLKDNDPIYVEVDRWEGTHAYAITPGMAQYLLSCIKAVGLNDSLDGQLGMRNMFDLGMVTVDPPPVVAVVGNRESCIESSGNPGFWNAYYTDRFLANLRAGAKVAGERKLIYSNKEFLTYSSEIEQSLKTRGKDDGRPLDVLVLGGNEGLSSVWLSNKLLKHNDSQMHIISHFANQNDEQILRFNTYFSKYYYKINVVSIGNNNTLLRDAVKDPDIFYDIILWDNNANSCEEIIHEGVFLWNLLSRGGILIFNQYDKPYVKEACDNLTTALWPTTTQKEKFITFYKI